MGSFRFAAPFGAALLAVCLTTPAPTAAQTPDAPSRPFKSVHGKLHSVDRARNGMVMTSDAGDRLAWQFNAAVIAEVARLKPGDQAIVIYRQLASNEKRVTAVAFPGTASKPTYINLTGERVVLRGAPAVGGECGHREAAPISQSELPNGGLTEITDACWCCAPAGEACTPGNQTGPGRAFLPQCFK